jgi:hypothetical protein
MMNVLWILTLLWYAVTHIEGLRQSTEPNKNTKKSEPDGPFTRRGRRIMDVTKLFDLE